MKIATMFKWGLPLLAAIAALSFAQTAVAQATGGCLSNTRPGVRNLREANCGGFPARISIPRECESTSADCGLIVQFAGITLSPEITNRNTELERLGTEGPQKFVVLGFGGKLVGPIPRFSAGDPQVLRSIVEDTIQRLRINPKRVHVSGFSQGGGVVFDFVCNSSDLIASAAAIAPAGVATPMLEANCFQNRTTIPIQLTQGTRDTLVNPAETNLLLDRILAGNGLQRSAGMVFKRADGITGTRFVNGNGGRIEFFQHEFTGATAGDGHCYPGSFEDPEDLVATRSGELLEMVDRFQVGCADMDQIRIGVEQMRFFQENPKP